MVHENGRRRVATYCRVSTSDQDCDRQERDLLEYAERSGFEVVEVYKETLSGIRKAKGKRPIERKRVMDLAQRRAIDEVLVTEMTRWGRSTQDLMDTLGQLASWDVSLVAQTGLTFDLSTPQGGLIANPMASLAEFEHDLLRERVRSGVAVETVKDGVRHGGTAINYAPLTRLLKEDGQVVGGTVRDGVTGVEHEVSARAVVNATGVFSDAVRRMDNARAPAGIRLSKGTHLVFNEGDVPLTATVVFDSPLDGRSLFLAKHEGCFLYGASDDWEDADPGDPAPVERDVEYLISSLAGFLPEARLTREKVRFAYSGFRPLPPTDGDSSDATREDRVEVSPSGLVSVMGGKMTTAGWPSAPWTASSSASAAAGSRAKHTCSPSAAPTRRWRGASPAGRNATRSFRPTSASCTSATVWTRTVSARRR